MPDTPTSQPFRSLRFRALVFFLGLTALVSIAIPAIASLLAQNQSQLAQQISAQALRTQAEDYLLQLTFSSARQNDQYLDRIRLDTQSVADFAALIFDDTAAFDAAFWPASEHMFAGDNGIYLNGEEDTSSVFVPNTQSINAAVIRDIELSAYLDLLFEPVMKNNPNIEAVYFATQRDMTRYYPNVGLGLLVPPDFRATQRPWYSGSTAENNPDRAAWWTPAYVDATGLGLVTTAAAPVYSKSGQLIGVVGFDVTLTEMKTALEATQILQNGYTFIVDNTGHSIALPEQGFVDFLGRSAEEGEASVDLTGAPGDLGNIISSMLAGETGFQEVTSQGSIQLPCTACHEQRSGVSPLVTNEGHQLFIAFAPLENTGWSLASVVSAKEVLQAVASIETDLERETQTIIWLQILPFSGVIFVVVMVLAWVITNRLVSPIRRLAAAAQQVGAGHWDVALPPPSNDEIGILGGAFKKMTAQIKETIGQLEQRVAQRTGDLERRTLQLRATGQVAREAAAIRDLAQLLEKTAQLISSQFGFYHTGIFLLDDSKEYAVLQAVSSEGGQRMLARGHRLAVGEEGIVGYVSKRGESRIALDVGADAVFFRNPDLPETRSEIALPLKVRGAVIGVLDVQSEQPSAFLEEDIEILQVLADQIALAIENASLIEDSQQSLRELNALYSQQVRQAWGARLAKRPLAFRYNRMGVQPAPKSSVALASSLPEKAIIIQENGEERILAPLMVRGEKLGYIVLRREPGQGNWSEDDLTLVEESAAQIAASLETARLLDELQKHAQQERLIGEVAAKMQGAHNVETALRTAVHELGAVIGAARVQIRLERGTPSATVLEGTTGEVER